MSEEIDPKPATDAKPAAPKKAAARKTPAKKPAAAKAAAAKKPATKKAAAQKAQPKKAPTKKPAAAKSSATASASAAEPAAEAQKARATAEATAEPDQAHQEDSRDFIDELKHKDWGACAVRGLLMLLFGFIAWWAMIGCFVLAAVQFAVMILTGKPNDTITSWILTIGKYVNEVTAFLSFKTEDRPFPFGNPLPYED